MKHSFRLFGAFVLMVCAHGFLMAEKQVTGEEMQADPKKYDGQKVFIYVDSVTFPAKRTDAAHGFSDFVVVTALDSHNGQSGKNPNRTIGDRDKSGAICVRVPSVEVEEFSKTYSVKASQGPSGARKKLTGTFRANKASEGGFLDLTDGSCKDIDSPKRGRN